MSRVRSTDRRFYGVTNGVVAEQQKESDEGRVPLRLPWYDPQLVTDPARVCQLHAGNGYGALWTPHVGEEVLVAFMHGDMRHPVVLGGLYNGKDKAPSQDRNQKVLKTKGGHSIIVDDTAETITVATRTGTSVTLDGKTKEVRIAADAKITLKARDIEIIADGGDVTVSGTTIRLN